MDDGDSDLPRPLAPVPAPVPALESFVNQTVFDVHFSRANRKSHHPTSPFRACGATLKGRVQNVDCTLGRHERPPHERGRATRCGAYKWFAQYSAELAQGFDLCFDGYDSNRPIINAFVKSKCATRSHVVVINGYIPSLRVKDILGPTEQVPGLANATRTRAGVGWRQAAPRGRRSGFTTSSATRPPSTSSCTTSTRQPSVMQRHAQCSRRSHCTRVSTSSRQSIVFTRRCRGRARKLQRASTRTATQQQPRSTVLVRGRCQARAGTVGVSQPDEFHAIRRGDRRVARRHYSPWSCNGCGCGCGCGCWKWRRGCPRRRREGCTWNGQVRYLRLTIPARLPASGSGGEQGSSDQATWCKPICDTRVVSQNNCGISRATVLTRLQMNRTATSNTGGSQRTLSQW